MTEPPTPAGASAPRRTELPLGIDAYSPREIAARVDAAGVAKTRLPALTTFVLGVLAGAFIGLGALYYTLVVSDATLGFALGRVLGALCFTLGLLLVVVAGAELFTGNNLLAMAWADGRVTSREVLRNWVIVACANFVGAAGLAALVYLSGHPGLNDGAVGETIVAIAGAKAALPFWTAFVRGVLCNVLVCLAVWMSFAGRSVTDKFFAIVLPISAFVAAGFEHSIANMYFFPLAMLLQGAGVAPGVAPIGVLGMLGNLLPVILGNIAGGSVLVALVYWIVYLRPAPRAP